MVYGAMRQKDSFHEHDVIQFYDVVTNKIVLELGTESVDDYYPCCVMSWHPENLAININRIEKKSKGKIVKSEKTPEYQLYGEEWERAVMNMPKKAIVEMLKAALMKEK